MTWTPQGPRPGTDGQSEGITDREIVGAVNAVVPHPANPDLLYIGAVNGGVWKTENARDARPDWVSLMPNEASLSIGALCLDRGSAEAKTLVAGAGRFSSMRRVGGALLEVMRSTDDGASWSIHDNGGVFRSLHIRAIHAHGDVIVLSANATGGSSLDGVYRSDDAGQSFTHVSPSDLQSGPSLAMAASRENADLIYAHAGASLHRSDDAGLTWTKISPGSMDLRLSGATNVRIAPGPGLTVFVAIARNSKLSDLFWSTDGGANWTALDLPVTFEAGGHPFGIHPGAQAGIHFSLAADAANEGMVYVGGDRQPAFNEGPTPPGPPPRQFPNSIDADTYSGRLFRVDASQATGAQASPITHRNTASNSAPHADSRCMAIDCNGDLIEGDDGGVYRRSDPGSDTGDWVSVIGTLANTEIHSAAWDAAAQVALAGTQDNGTLQQDTSSGARWPTVIGGDGGVVAIASRGAANGSIRYASFQFLGAARRDFFDANGNRLGAQRLQLREVGTTLRLTPQFYTPIQVNRAAPDRLIICGSNAVWESFDRGDTLRLVGPVGIRGNGAAAVAYGGTNDADVLYVGAGRDVFVRTGPAPANLTRSSNFSLRESITGVAFDPETPTTAFATVFSGVFMTDDAGQTWADITNDLFTEGARIVRSVAWCGNVGNGQVVVGTNSGIYAAEAPNFDHWTALGTGLPAAPVMQLQYDEADSLLLAATLGRGAWTINLAQPFVAMAGDGDANPAAHSG